DACGGRVAQHGGASSTTTSICGNVARSKSHGARRQCPFHRTSSASGGRFVVPDDSDRHEGGGGVIGGLPIPEGTLPGIEAGWCDPVPITEVPDGEAPVLPELDPASPVLFFARIARFAVGHEGALLSEDIRPRLSRTRLAGRTRKCLSLQTPFPNE